MGLFFDQDWFDDRLKASGLTRATLAHAAGMTVDEIEMAFRDQRELEQREVRAIARALRADPDEVANRSGASPVGSPGDSQGRGFGEPEPGFVVTREVIAGLHERLDRLERLVELVIAKLDKGR